MNLKKLREKQKLSMTELARAVGCHKQQIYNFEIGVASVPAKYIRRLCKALKISEKKYVDSLVASYRVGLLTAINQHQ